MRRILAALALSATFSIATAGQNDGSAAAAESRNSAAYSGIAANYQENSDRAGAEETGRDRLARLSAPAHSGREVAQSELGQPPGFREAAEMAELGFFALILLVLARDVWRERRILRRRHLAGRVLLPALLALLLLAALFAIDVSFSGSRYAALATAAQLIEPLALGALLTFIMIWRLRYERPPRRRTVLAIGAHPDDIEFGCGATMIRLREEGAATYGLVFTGGERGHDKPDAGNVRVDEACSAARVMALSDVVIHNFSDTSLHLYKAQIRAAIEEAIERWRPDTIFTHNRHDAHTDHKTVFDATREAARGACSILCYENPNTPPSFRPGYFIDVGDYLDGKITALACHKTQKGKPYAAADVVRAMAGFRGTQARVPLAEGFEAVRILERARER